MSNKTPDILITALRQYQHNNCSGFVTGFDYDETVMVVKSLEAQRDELLVAFIALHNQAYFIGNEYSSSNMCKSNIALINSIKTKYEAQS